ncbi:MAG: tyrosine protein kinase [Nocardioidaceae bacterium]|nr:tyrosine protein kinase [Nocardioidaceae bacterium]
MLFSDIEASTLLATRLGNRWFDVLDQQRQICRAAWSQWNGVEMGTEGDSFFVVFDDPLDAVNAAIQVQQNLGQQSWPEGEDVRLRIGLHTGAAVRHEIGFVGVEVHRAARVSSAAHGGQTVISGITAGLVRDNLPAGAELLDLGTHTLKDIDKPEHLYQVSTDGLPTTFAPPRVEGGAELRVKGIADFRFVRFLGESGHGSVYVAVPPDRLGLTARFVTVKVIPGVDTEAAARRADREIRSFAAVQSPYLVQVLDTGQHGGDFFYAMEFCELGTLAAPERTLSRGEVLRAVAHAARAAQSMHEAGLVHRGIKPSNVMLTEDGARLADLGLAQELDPDHSLTSLGAITGVDFMDPGQLSGETASVASDVWSLAATLHWGLSGEGLFGPLPANDPLFSIRKVLTSPPRISSTLEPADADLIAQCVQGPLGQRPASALALAEAIEALLP